MVAGREHRRCVQAVRAARPPSGWTVVRQITEVDGTASLRFAVLKRTAGGSEPSSWTGALSATVKPVVTQVSAYRNADTAANQFIAENTSQSGSGNTVSSATVTNTDSRAWRVSAFGASGDYYTAWGSTSQVTERSDTSAEYQISTFAYRTATLMMADSNGPVGTGSHSRTGGSGPELLRWRVVDRAHQAAAVGACGGRQ